MKIKGPFVKLIMFYGTKVLNLKSPLFKSKLKIKRCNGSI